MFFLCMWRIMSNEYTVGVVWIWIGNDVMIDGG